MRKLLILVFFLAAVTFTLPVAAQNATLNGQCLKGGQFPNVFGTLGNDPFLASYPSCTVTVYLTGTLTKATLVAPGPTSNPFTANTDGSWLFYAATGVGYDVVMSGGNPFTMPSSYTLTAVYTGASSASVSFPLQVPTGLGATPAITGANDQTLNVQPGTGQSARYSGEVYLGNNTIAGALSDLAPGQELVIDNSTTISANLTPTTQYTGVRCLPNTTISYTGNFTLNLNVPNFEWQHCSFIGQGVNVSLTNIPICIAGTTAPGCTGAGNVADHISFHDNSINGFGTSTGVQAVRIGICDVCKFYNNTTGDVGVGTVYAISSSVAPIVVAPTTTAGQGTNTMLTAITFTVASTTGLQLSNTLKVQGWTGSNGVLNMDFCTITLLTSTTFTCEDKKASPTGSYTAQAGVTAQQVGNAGSDFYWQIDQNAEYLRDAQIFNNRVGEFSIHVQGGATLTSCPRAENFTESGNHFYVGMNGKLTYAAEIGDFSSANCQTPTNFAHYNSYGNTCEMVADGTNGCFSFSTMSDWRENGDGCDAAGHTYKIYCFEHVAAQGGAASALYGDLWGYGGGFDGNRGSSISAGASTMMFPCANSTDCSNGPKAGYSFASNAVGQLSVVSGDTLSGSVVNARADLCPTTVLAAPGNCTAPGAVGNGTTATYTTTRPHGFHVGDTVYINGLLSVTGLNCSAGCTVLGGPTNPTLAPTTSVPFQFSITNATTGTDGNQGIAGVYAPTGGQVAAIEVGASGSGSGPYNAFTLNTHIIGNTVLGGAPANGVGMICSVGTIAPSLNLNTTFENNDVSGFGTAMEMNACQNMGYAPGMITNVTTPFTIVNSSASGLIPLKPIVTNLDAISPGTILAVPPLGAVGTPTPTYAIHCGGTMVIGSAGGAVAFSFSSTTGGAVAANGSINVTVTSIDSGAIVEPLGTGTTFFTSASITGSSSVPWTYDVQIFPSGLQINTTAFNLTFTAPAGTVMYGSCAIKANN